MQAAVEIRGLREFRAALRRTDPALTKGVTKALKESAEIVAQEARSRAPERSGKLKGSIRSFTKGDRAGVRANARRVSRAYPGGYPYPRRLEFERSGRARPFLGPALEAKREEVARRMDRVVDDVAEIWSG